MYQIKFSLCFVKGFTINSSSTLSPKGPMPYIPLEIVCDCCPATSDWMGLRFIHPKVAAKAKYGWKQRLQCFFPQCCTPCTTCTPCTPWSVFTKLDLSGCFQHYFTMPFNRANQHSSKICFPGVTLRRSRPCGPSGVLWPSLTSSRRTSSPSSSIEALRIWMYSLK